MEGYDLGGISEFSEISEKVWLYIFIIWTPQPEILVHQSQWTFGLEWNSDLQAFSIFSMILRCPKNGKERKRFITLH